MDLIAKREKLDTEPTTWLVAVDSRGLDLRDCGCGKPVMARMICVPPFPGKPIIEAFFFHSHSSCCKMAFATDDYRPLEYREYCGHLGLEADIDG